MNTNTFLRECLPHAFSHYWGYPGEKNLTWTYCTLNNNTKKSVSFLRCYVLKTHSEWVPPRTGEPGWRKRLYSATDTRCKLTPLKPESREYKNSGPTSEVLRAQHVPQAGTQVPAILTLSFIHCFLWGKKGKRWRCVRQYLMYICFGIS